jgi:hypothetical protein
MPLGVCCKLWSGRPAAELHRIALALKAQKSLSAVALKTDHNQMRVLPTSGNEEHYAGILLWK